MGSLKIISSGLISTVQDLGRKHLKYYAIPSSGAMDTRSFKAANSIIANPENNPCLEFNFLPPKIEFMNPCQIALTGADMNFKLNSVKLEMNSCVAVEKGDILSGSWAQNNARSYMALNGVLEIEKLYGSVSPFIYGSQKASPSVLDDGDILNWNAIQSKSKGADINLLPESFNCIKVHKGPEFHLLKKQSIDFLLTQKFSLSSDSSRMGARIKERVPDPELEALQFSVPVLPGFIQLTKAGELIVLLQDAQTTGGYPRILYMQEEELMKFNQIAMNQEFKFDFQQ